MDESIVLNKTPREVMKCQSCNWTVMDYSDHENWKGIDMGNGVFHWHCHKELCRKMFEEKLEQRKQEMAVMMERGADHEGSQ